jgi:hypothetical protein
MTLLCQYDTDVPGDLEFDTAVAKIGDFIVEYLSDFKPFKKTLQPVYQGPVV